MCFALYILFRVCAHAAHATCVWRSEDTFRSGTGFSLSSLLSHGLSCFCCTVSFKLAGRHALEQPSCLLTSSEQEFWDCRNEGSHAGFWVAGLVVRMGSQCISPLSVSTALLAFLHGELVLELGNIGDKVGLYRPFEEICRIF